MSKFYYEAIKRIPKKFIDDDTRSCELLDGTVFIANKKYPPMIYDAKIKKFIEYIPTHEPFLK